MQHDWSVVVLLEALLALLVLTIPALWEGRDAAMIEVNDSTRLPLPTRLWRLAGIMALASYTSTIVTHATGFLEIGPNEAREQSLRFVGGVLIAAPYFFLSAVALGAPWKEMVDRTAAWALIMGILVGGPLGAAAPSLQQLRLPPLWQGPPGETALIRFRALGCCAGAWVGAFVVPLDWAMPFQEWPLPLVVGAVAGHSLGSFAVYCDQRWTHAKGVGHVD
ncbi:phosphatidylinositol-glycan biosynthesis class f [Nannochloropsis gaditana]|uniref:Phosphatidylinositol-glycan biosynthesis class f n=1 Tax=Nannochloropsis gaditana TaxID=72520 RepID=W7UAQ4_9STRA|nr:phosphatidylinositol-glycan biosynthesis class f [Nannochloropsis gaditana]